MFLGFDDSLKFLKRELKDAGVDVSFLRQWQKAYDKVRQQEPVLRTQYLTAKQDLETVFALLRDMEKRLIHGAVEKDVLVAFAKEMKKYQGRFNQEFLIGKEDVDFHSTHMSIIKQCEKDMKEKGNALILQSEIENLLAITREALEKKWPDFRAMAFFYLERVDGDISELPHQDKVARVEGIYELEFKKPFLDAVGSKLEPARITKIMEEELWNY